MINRRTAMLGLVSSSVLLPTPALARAKKSLNLHRPRTNETVEAELSAVRIARKHYDQLNWLLRDVSAGVATEIDTNLLWIACQIAETLDVQTLHVRSGYRTKGTNAGIRGAAKRSFHVKAMALDFFAPGVPTSKVVAAARTSGAGGIGWYPARGFVHIDTGPKRYWKR